MGIPLDVLHWFTVNATPPPGSILELGNQVIHDGRLEPSAKSYFEKIGYVHTSIDTNGLDGALPLDLSKPIGINNRFDMATDFGTSEHVDCLWECLRNVHNHTYPGGVIFHVNPAPENWPKHGLWYRDEEFYRHYAQITGYAVINLHRRKIIRSPNADWQTWCVMVRSAQNFPDKEHFYKLPIKRA